MSTRTTILLVDDDDSFRRTLRRELEVYGYEVTEAADGATALETLAIAADGAGPMPDVVMLDVCMPSYSGLGVLRAMRTFEHSPPTIVMTGFQDPSVDVLARSLGAMRIFKKPVELDDVLDAVLAAAKGSSVRPAPQ